MIGAFWNALFEYVDKAVEEKDAKRVEIAREIEDILQKAYDESQRLKIKVKTVKGTPFDDYLLSSKEFEVYQDPTDGTYFGLVDNYYVANNFDIFKNEYVAMNQKIKTTLSENGNLKIRIRDLTYSNKKLAQILKENGITVTFPEEKSKEEK